MSNERLVIMRNGKNLTQGQVASAVGISQSMYARIEAGDRSPRLETMAKLAKFFGVTVDWLFCEKITSGNVDVVNGGVTCA
jgi:putative transcriptional regulator